jgi:hypothetical protein
MRLLGPRYIFRCCAMFLLGLVVVTAPTGSVAQTRPSGAAAAAKVNGRYEIVFAGYLSGRGNGVVGGPNVIIQGQVTDETGATGNFIARCKRNGNYFRGTGSAPGGSVTVKGRLDPSNKSLRAARLTCTYIISSAKTGRIAGDRKGP